MTCLLCIAAAILGQQPACARIGETLNDLVSRYGEPYKTLEGGGFVTYFFRGPEFVLRATAYDSYAPSERRKNVVEAETYFSTQPLIKGAMPNGAVRKIMDGEAPRYIWRNVKARTGEREAFESERKAGFFFHASIDALNDAPAGTTFAVSVRRFVDAPNYSIVVQPDGTAAQVKESVPSTGQPTDEAIGEEAAQKALGQISPPSNTPQFNKGSWQLAPTASPIDDSVTYVFTLRGNSQNAGDVSLSVYLRKAPRRSSEVQNAIQRNGGVIRPYQAEVHFASDQSIDGRVGNSGDITALGRIRWNKNPPEFCGWSTRDSRKAVFLNADRFLQQLLVSSALRLELPTVSGSMIAEFDVRGFKERLRECPTDLQRALEQSGIR
jgi:hypothetical protein